MDTFPKNAPRKKRDIPFHKNGGAGAGLITIHTAGVEVTPFIIHKKFDPNTALPVKKGLWTVTHLFTGKSIGVQGSYKFCKAVAEELFDEVLLYLPCETMWVDHPDVRRVGQKIQNLKSKHEALGRW